MKLQHLRFFTAVAEYGGVTKAAERLHLSQPAISAGLKALEQELGRPLFHRGPDRRLHLTEDGERFRHHALAILRQCDAAKAALARGRAPRTLRLGVASTLPTKALAHGVAAFRVRRPDLALTFREGAPDQLERLLAQGRIDAALSVADADDPPAGFRPLYVDPFQVMAPPGHRWAGNGAIGLADLGEEPFILRLSCELARKAQARLTAAGAGITIAARATSDATAFALVAAGIGVTLAPRSLHPAGLTMLELRDLALTRAVGLRWRPEAIGAELAEELAGIAEAFGTPPR